MRVRLTNDQRLKLFGALLKKNKNWNKIALSQSVSIKTLNFWRNGLSTIPLKNFESLLIFSGFSKKDFNPEFVPDFWYASKAGKLGARKILKLYGNFGTLEGRRKGGLASISVHLKNPAGKFKILKKIKKPLYSIKFAELLGILVGDGHLSEYQVSITTNSETDKEHAFFCKNLIEKLFNVEAVLQYKKTEKAVAVIVFSKNLVNFLFNHGMPKGNKINNSLDVPKWILKKKSYKIAFIRGLFDTDGCIYLDKHRIKNIEYKHLGWTITSYAENLVKNVINILKSLNFSPTFRRTQKSVYLRKQNEIHRYFKEIKTHNSKHYNRYKKFTEEYRSGHNGAVSKTAVLF